MSSRSDSAAHAAGIAKTRLRRWRTVRWKLAALFGILFSAGSLLLFFESRYLFDFLSHFARQQTNSAVAGEIAERVQALLDRKAAFDELARVGDEIARYNPDAALYVLDGAGNILEAFSPHTVHVIPTVPIEPIERFLSNPLDSLPVYNVDPRDGGKQVFSAARLTIGGEPGYIYFVIDGSGPLDRARGVARENSFVVYGLAVIGCSFFGTLAIALVALSLVARRFEAITATVRSYGEGNLGLRLRTGGNDELDELARRINEMAATIESNLHESQHRDQLRRELIANISHDLRSPASHIRIAAEKMLAERTADGGIIDGHPALSVQASVAVLERMLRELFELANLEANEAKPDSRYFSIDELFGDLELRFRGEAAEKDIALTFTFAPETPLVFADPRLIGRALTNLIGNALRYTPRGGSVAVSAEPVPNGVILRVSDTGVGIASGELPRLFERYYRGSDSRNEMSDSTGLGLAITRRIIELHGSRIAVESTPQKGTTFSFELPVTSQEMV